VSESGLQKTQGGAIGIRLGVQLNLTLTSFVSNVARGGNIVAMGGAIFAEAFVLIDECSFLGNKAIGVLPVAFHRQQGVQLRSKS
jgi:hypothetical protein